MARPLDGEEIERQLRDLPGWRAEGGRLRRTVEAPDFRTVIRMVDDIAEVAEQMDHHPDFAVHWRTLDLTLWTHTADAITQLDVELAHRVEEIACDHGAA